MGKALTFDFSTIRPRDRILTAVSGGPDSVALLDYLAALRNKYNLKIVVAHLNHGLRRAALGDQRYVQTLGRRYSLPLVIKRINVNHNIKRGESLETAARRLRYGFLGAAAKKFKCNKIATAHTLDDQAETVLMRLIRGSGLLGLSGIPAQRRSSDITIIRPLLGTGKKEILSYLKARGLKYRTDSSNLNRSFLRNRLRLDILKRLERINPKIKKILAQTAQNISEDYAWIAAEKRRVFKSLIRKKGRGLRLNIARLKGLPVSIQKEVWRECVRRLGLGMRKISYVHWKQFATLITLKGKKRTIELPGKARAVRQKTGIYLLK